MQLIIGGDLVPTESNFGLFNTGNVKSLLGEELFHIWNDADIRIFNLEVPLTDAETPIDKNGPNLIAPTSTVNGIKALAPSLITLANNHILDQGENGLNDTIAILNDNRIPFVGVGSNLKNTIQSYVIEQDGCRIGIYACAENEFSIASETTSGANPFDALESLDHIVKLKSRCDFVIVLYHGGKEHYRYPSPYLQKVCRKMTEKGADLIVCQHSHCIGSYEVYNQSTIIYGQGNFIFDRSESELWKTSILIKVTLTETSQIEFIPICKLGNRVILADKYQSQSILQGFKERSDKIKNQEFVNDQYNKIALENKMFYLRQLAGYPKWLRGLDKLILNGKLTDKIYSKEKLNAIKNIVECEAHRELLLRSIGNDQTSQNGS